MVELMKYVVDTNIFNRLADGTISQPDLPQNSEFIATHIQLDEINHTQDAERRARLLLVFAKMAPSIVPTETWVLGKSRLGEFKLGEGHQYSDIKAKLDSKNANRINNVDDALIAEVAINNGYGLITSDNDLASVARDKGIHVIFISPNQRVQIQA